MIIVNCIMHCKNHQFFMRTSINADVLIQV